MFKQGFLISLLLLSFLSKGQQFGGFPPSKKWLLIEDTNHRIIFTKENEKIARQSNSVIKQINKLQPNIGLKRRDISIIFQKSTAQANGYVGLAPFVSEFFLSPLPNSYIVGSLPWAYTLTVHEYQHVLQYANSYRGLSKIGYWFGGEASWSFFQQLSIPNWFFEGDAVRAETQYSEQGRGRNAYFFNGYRAFAIQNKFPRYDKARNGSIQDFVPSHYPLGYLMIDYGRAQYGNEFWPTVLKEASAYKGIFYPFSRALKRNSGLNVNRFYDASLDHFSKKWDFKEPILGNSLTSRTKNEVSNDYFPQFSEDSSLYFLNSTYDKIGRFYRIKNDEKEGLNPLGISLDNYFDVKNNKLIFSRYYFHPRWGWIDYSDIVCHDLNSKQSKRITRGKKYFHPSFSPNGGKIAALSVQENGNYSIHILDAQEGLILDTIKSEQNYYHTYPTWKNDSILISASRDTLGRMAIVRINVSTRELDTLSPWTYHLLGRPMVKGDSVLFSASYDGIDNIYQVSSKSNSTTQLTSAGLGRYQASWNPNSDSLIFTEFSLQGFQLKKVAAKNLEENSISTILPLKEISYYNATYPTNQSSILPTPSSSETKPYPKTKALINPHSWNLALLPPNYGISIESDNVLNTLDMNLGYEYNANEEKGGVNFNAIYGQYYLRLNAGASTTNRSFNVNAVQDSSIDWTENELRIGLSLPLNYTANLFSRRLLLSSTYNYTDAQFESDQLNNLEIHYSESSIFYTQQRVKARKNIFTHLGLYANLNHKNGINQGNLSQSLIQTSFALPGIFQNDNLILDADAQFIKGRSTYRFRDNFNYSRGFLTPSYDDIIKLSANYHFSLFYPDRGVLGIAYLYRIRANLFYDYSLLNSTFEMSSTGAELIFVCNFFNTFELPIGFRYANILAGDFFSEGSSTNVFEIFIPLERF